MARSRRRILGTAALIALGAFLALAVLECGLRVAGRIYLQRQEAANNASLERRSDYRILCLGESTTISLASDPKDRYPAQLEILLNEWVAGTTFTVINRGVPATNTDRILEKLPEQLDRYEPHVVVAMMGINDQRLAAPEFQVSEALRVWKLAMMFYHQLRKWLSALDSESETAPSRQNLSPESEGQASYRRESARLLRRARAQIQRGNAPEGEALALRATKITPDNPRAYLLLGDARAARGWTVEAAAAYRTAVDLDPKAVVMYLRTTPLTSAVEIANVLDGLENEAVSLIGRAAIELRQHRVSQAEHLARRATEMDPENTTAFLLLGEALAAQGRADQARAAYRAAADLQLRPTLSHLFLRDPKTALAIAREDAARHPDDPERKSLLESAEQLTGFAYLKQGDLDAAETQLLEIAERSENKLASYGALTILYLRKGDLSTAERYHDRLRKSFLQHRNPRTRENYRMMRRLLAERGIQLVAMQYPMRRVGALKQLLDPAPDVIFVDNEKNFKRALLNQPHGEIFRDLFAGDFGHLTAQGNRLLAESVARAIMDLVSRGSAERRNQRPSPAR